MKRTRKSFNQFRFPAVLQKRVYIKLNNKVIEDYQNLFQIFCDIKGLSSYQKSFNMSVGVASTHKIMTRYFEEKVDSNYRFLFPWESSIHKITSFLDKTSRKEYLEFMTEEPYLHYKTYNPAHSNPYICQASLV